MKTRGWMATMWLGLVIVTVTLGFVSVGVLWDNRQLRGQGRDLRIERDALAMESTGLKAERDLIEQELRGHRRRVDELSAQLAELNLRTEAREAAGVQQAYRIRAFLENQVVGQGWLVPGRATTNANGQAVYEPVVVLDPPTRPALTPAVPKERAAAQPMSVTVNHNYPSAYDGVWPAYWVWWSGHDGQKPHRPEQPPTESTRFPVQPKPQPQLPSPFLSTRIWQPQTGWQKMPQGRPGGEWISSSPPGHSYVSSGTAAGTFPVRY